MLIRMILILCVIIISCKNAKHDSAKREASIDSFRMHINKTVQHLRNLNLWDSANIYLNKLEDTVREINHDRLSLTWRIQKVQHFTSENQFDSATAYINNALSLLGKKGMGYKDSFNTYVIYLYLLQNQGLEDSALRIANEAYYLARNDSFRTTTICVELAKMYGDLNDMPNMRKYMMKAWAFRDNGSASEYTTEIAKLFLGYYDKLGQVDSALYYLNIVQNSPGRYNRDPAGIAQLYEISGLFLVDKGRLQEGIQNQLKAKHILDSLGSKEAGVYNNLADSYMISGDFEKAFTYIDSSLIIGAQKKDYHLLSLSWRTKSELYFKKSQYRQAYAALDSSYEYYTSEMDSSLRDHARELEAKYSVREKDNEIKSLAIANQANLKIRNQQKLIIVTMITALVLLATLGFLLWRRRQTQMQIRETNLKQQLLRTQMEPHFLFNALGILQNLIRTNGTEKAIAYLRHLAKLMRFNFENASENFVLLKNETDALESYLNLQKLYRPDLFESRLEIYEGYEEDEIYIPPMLLQPFVENAIEHGFSDISYYGKLLIKIDKRNHTLHCVIEDNGKGMEVLKKPNRSRSTDINEERLSILAKQTGRTAKLNIIDKKAENKEKGIRVEIEIPFKNYHRLEGSSTVPNLKKLSIKIF